MNALYIGIHSAGTTSRMRADTLRKVTAPARWSVIDTDQAFRQAARLWKTVAFRFKSGPLVRVINRQVMTQTATQQFDLVWVDKGVYLRPETVGHLRKQAKCLVHFTPDTAFHANRSRHFYAAARLYDLLVTTKSFELEQYVGIADAGKIHVTTQAYDAELHCPPNPLPEKKPVAAFIGLCEPDRESCVEELLAAGVPVRVGGRGWDKFVSRHRSDPGLHYLGSAVFGAEYVSEYAAAAVGLGLLSKRFPELHTTRTFEIPAIGTLLATERTVETERYFGNDEVLFFGNYRELAARLADLLKNPEEVSAIATKGHQRVIAGGHDYASVLTSILQRLPVII